MLKRGRHGSGQKDGVGLTMPLFQASQADADAEQSSCNELATRLTERAKTENPDDPTPLNLIRKIMQR